MKNSTMTQEQKELLLKDLCARLPYGTMVYAQNTVDWYDSEICTQVLSDVINEDYIVKPYLFPLSEMTDKQYKEMQEFVGDYAKVFRKTMGKDCALELWLDADECDATIYLEHIFDLQNWLNKNHFDYRGLIEKSLALDATGLNIY